MNYKDTKPYKSAFLSVDLLTDFAAFCLTDFIDWRCTHSWFVFSTQLVNCCPPWTGRNYTCVLLSVAPLLYLLSDLLPPPPLPNVQYIQTMCDCGGGVEMYCGPSSAGVLNSVSDQIRNLQNCFTAPNKMTSEDDIKGLVSLTSFVHGS
jgi:hypothetical protein